MYVEYFFFLFFFLCANTNTYFTVGWVWLQSSTDLVAVECNYLILKPTRITGVFHLRKLAQTERERKNTLHKKHTQRTTSHIPGTCNKISGLLPRATIFADSKKEDTLGEGGGVIIFY